VDAGHSRILRKSPGAPAQSTVKVFPIRLRNVDALDFLSRNRLCMVVYKDAKNSDCGLEQPAHSKLNMRVLAL
jgi:hypothetical protein